MSLANDLGWWWFELRIDIKWHRRWYLIMATLIACAIITLTIGISN